MGSITRYRRQRRESWNMQRIEITLSEREEKNWGEMSIESENSGEIPKDKVIELPDMLANQMQQKNINKTKLYYHRCANLKQYSVSNHINRLNKTYHMITAIDPNQHPFMIKTLS